MFENVMSRMGGTAVFGIVSITLFFVFFIGLAFWAARLKKPYLESMCELPLEGEPSHSPASANTEDRHE